MSLLASSPPKHRTLFESRTRLCVHISLGPSAGWLHPFPGMSVVGPGAGQALLSFSDISVELDGGSGVSGEALCRAGIVSVLGSQWETAPLSHTALGRSPHIHTHTSVQLLGLFPPQRAPPNCLVSGPAYGVPGH